MLSTWLFIDWTFHFSPLGKMLVSPEKQWPQALVCPLEVPRAWQTSRSSSPFCCSLVPKANQKVIAVSPMLEALWKGSAQARGVYFEFQPPFKVVLSKARAFVSEASTVIWVWVKTTPPEDRRYLSVLGTVGFCSNQNSTKT